MSVLAQQPADLGRLFAERASAGDLEGLMELYEEGAMLVGPDGGDARGRNAIRGRLETLLAMAPRMEPTDSHFISVGDVALLSNRWKITLGSGPEGKNGQGRMGLEAVSTEVVRQQQDGTWLYVIDDYSATPTARPAQRSQPPGGWQAEQLIYSENGPVARITLNRPERRNALSIQLSDELTSALERVSASEKIKVLVIDGAGETFCAGDDITEMALWGDANEIMRRVKGYQRMADMFEDLDKITIAAVDGYAVGGGLEITMACDFVVATKRAIWGMPEIDVGITPGWGGTTRMARLIGRRMTKEINILGALHPASRAAELGLWNRVVDNDRLDAEIDALIGVLLAKNQQAVRQLKFIINSGVEADLHTAQAFESLSAGLTGAVNGAWQVKDADQGLGIVSFISAGEQWRTRREVSRGFWTDGPIQGGDVN